MTIIVDYKPLMFNAIQESNLPLIREAITAGLSVDMTDANDMTMLHHAANEGRLQVVTLLLELGANPDIQKPDGGFTPLHYATYRTNPSIVKALLDGKASPHIHSRGQGTPLHMAAFGGDAESIELLVNAGADVFLKRGDLLPIDIVEIRYADKFNFQRHRYPDAKEMLVKKMAERETVLAAQALQRQAVEHLKKRQSAKFQL